MTKRPEIDAQPIHITRWERIWVDGGVLYSTFWSGATAYVVAMGPTMAVKGMAMTQQALTSAHVLPFICR